MKFPHSSVPNWSQVSTASPSTQGGYSEPDRVDLEAITLKEDQHWLVISAGFVSAFRTIGKPIGQPLENGDLPMKHADLPMKNEYFT